MKKIKRMKKAEKLNIYIIFNKGKFKKKGNYYKEKLISHAEKSSNRIFLYRKKWL